MNKLAASACAGVIGILIGLAASSMAQTPQAVVRPRVQLTPAQQQGLHPNLLRLPVVPNPAERRIPVFIMVEGSHRDFGNLHGLAQVGGASISVPGERDHDQDRHVSAAFGGDDCDDTDPHRFPGNAEVADRQGHDEDCDLNTVGDVDQDHDGFIAHWASNIARDASGQPVAVYRGSDCDDVSDEVHPGVPEIANNLRDDNCDGLVDVVEQRGHVDYCAPTADVAVSQAASGCGMPGGDLTQFHQ